MSISFMKPSAARAAVLVLDLHALLIKIGPSDQEDLRERLCVASGKRFAAAVNDLVRSKVCERGGKALRLIGDTRPWPSRSLQASWQKQREAA